MFDPIFRVMSDITLAGALKDTCDIITPTLSPAYNYLLNNEEDLDNLIHYFPMSMTLEDFSDNSGVLSLTGDARFDRTKGVRGTGSLRLGDGDYALMSTGGIMSSTYTDRSLLIWISGTNDNEGWSGDVYTEENASGVKLLQVVANFTDDQIDITVRDDAGDEMDSVTINPSSMEGWLLIDIDDDGAFSYYFNSATAEQSTTPVGSSWDHTGTKVYIGHPNNSQGFYTSDRAWVSEVYLFNGGYGSLYSTLTTIPRNAKTGRVDLSSLEGGPKAPMYRQTSVPCRSTHIFGGGQRSGMEKVTAGVELTRFDRMFIIPNGNYISTRSFIEFEGKKYNVALVQDAGGAGHHWQVFTTEDLN